MISVESDEMTAVWQKESLNFTFYITFSNSILNSTTFVKEFYDLMLSTESDKVTAD